MVWCYNIGEMATQPTSKVEVTVIRGNGYAPTTYFVPTKFTPETRRIILEALSAGHYKSTAFALASISPTVFNTWMKKGQIEPDEPGYNEEYHQFYLDCLRAEGKAEDFAVRTWYDAAQEDWKAASTFLAARFPGRWSSRTKIELTGDEGGPIEFTLKLDTMARNLNEANDEVDEDSSPVIDVTPDFEGQA